MLGWKVMPIASNKSSQSSTLPSSSSASSDSSAFNSTVVSKNGNEVNGIFFLNTKCYNFF